MGVKRPHTSETNGVQRQESQWARQTDFETLDGSVDAMQDEIDHLNSLPHSYDYTATADVDSGTVTSYTEFTMTDSTKNWIVNSMADKVVKLMTTALEEEYCIVVSNTATTLTFDCSTTGLAVTSYRIMSTFPIDKTHVISVVSFDIRTNCCAVILPNVSDVENRKDLYIYNELANNGDHKLIIICRGADRMRANKWITLEHKWEGVDIYAHYRTPLHWDILNIENVKRYINALITSNITLNSSTYVPILAEGSSTTLSAKRFIAKTVSGIRWAKYKSVVNTEFLCSGTLQLTKPSGGFSIVELTIRIKKFIGGTIIDYTSEATIARLSNGQIISVPIHIPFTLEQNDELTCIAKNNDGAVTLDAGTIFTIREY